MPNHAETISHPEDNASQKVKDLIAVWKGIGKDGVVTALLAGVAAFTLYELKSSQSNLADSINRQTEVMLRFMDSVDRCHKEQMEKLKEIENSIQRKLTAFRENKTSILGGEP